MNPVQDSKTRIDVQLPRELLLGNQAIGRGAWKAGVIFATGYAGTPSTEFIETLGEFLRHPEVGAGTPSTLPHDS